MPASKMLSPARRYVYTDRQSADVFVLPSTSIADVRICLQRLPANSSACTAISHKRANVRLEGREPTVVGMSAG
ncbi:hypothetical protein J6590_102953 [Homalodisca vitripennis]|nr:hypothetical protein J6590_102953 [Homalodisca vitripennis]